MTGEVSFHCQQNSSVLQGFSTWLASLDFCSMAVLGTWALNVEVASPRDKANSWGWAQISSPTFTAHDTLWGSPGSRGVEVDASAY